MLDYITNNNYFALLHNTFIIRDDQVFIASDKIQNRIICRTYSDFIETIENQNLLDADTAKLVKLIFTAKYSRIIAIIIVSCRSYCSMIENHIHDGAGDLVTFKEPEETRRMLYDVMKHLEIKRRNKCLQ